MQAETRLRQEYYDDLRVAVSAEESVTAQRAAAREQAAAEKWGETVKESKWMWGEYQRKWPPGERAPVDRSDDQPGSRRGDGDTGSWTALPTAELNRHATASPNGSGKRSRQRCAPWKARIQTGT